MPKSLIAASLGACLALGGLAYFLMSPSAPTGFDADAPPSERLLALESALDEERRARQLLEEELFRLIDEVDRLQGAAGSDDDEGGSNDEVDDGDEDWRETVQAAVAENRFDGRRSRDPESRADQLVAGGFSPDRAETIARREAELRMEAMQARFEARQSGEPVNFFEAQMGADQTLRAELGDTEYEQYLEASNRSTSIGINNVMEFSPAAEAGLQRGDRIVRYNGERVFNLGDLNRLQMQDNVGANVVIDVMRDGAPLQVTVPRGPLGVMASRGR
ncbi:MAG: PDZ domain-containing protein [Woeseiaceae bacterium]|nr:PDZ domain-containing protein [Woeseiaceae bacterium]